MAKISKDVNLTRHGHDITITIAAVPTMHFGHIQLREIETSEPMTITEHEYAEEELRDVARCYYQIDEEERP